MDSLCDCSLEWIIADAEMIESIIRCDGGVYP